MDPFFRDIIDLEQSDTKVGAGLTTPLFSLNFGPLFDLSLTCLFYKTVDEVTCTRTTVEPSVQLLP